MANLDNYNILILLSFGSAYLSESVYQGKSENLSLARFWGLLFWLFISAASGMEGLLFARLLSKIKGKNISAKLFVIIFTIISIIGFSPISLMTIVGTIVVILFPIFTNFYSL